MRKVIASINMSLDGFCDHTIGIADEELHQHYADLIKNAGTLLYGRTTYQMMESYWPTVVKTPTGERSTDDFAVAIGDVPKVVFSRTLKSVEPQSIGWKNITLARHDIKEEVTALKQQPGKDIFAGSPSLIDALTKLNMVDEFQLCIHPVIAGSGLPLFRNITDMSVLKLLKLKTFGSGAIVHYYEPLRK
ncbi:MAG: dihydrofolate reductase [Cyclobacteriaceae bacterium]|nr:dihydrofolate reductase [Cyclobacteriaceae bacterium]